MAPPKASSKVVLRALFETLADAIRYPSKNALLDHLPWAMQCPIQVVTPWQVIEQGILERIPHGICQSFE